MKPNQSKEASAIVQSLQSIPSKASVLPTNNPSSEGFTSFMRSPHHCHFVVKPTGYPENVPQIIQP